MPTGPSAGPAIASKSCRKSALANGAVSFSSAERSNALARCTGCKSGRSARGVVEPNIMTLPYSPARVPVVPVHSPIPPYGALVPPNAPSSHELTDRSFCSLVAQRCALVLRAPLPFDEFLEQRLLLIEAHDHQEGDIAGTGSPVRTSAARAGPRGRQRATSPRLPAARRRARAIPPLPSCEVPAPA